MQNTYVWELSQNPPWLDPAMAEELRNNIEALRMLEQEHGQVCHCFCHLTSNLLCDNRHQLSFAFRRLSDCGGCPNMASDLQVLMHLCAASLYVCLPDMIALRSSTGCTEVCSGSAPVKLSCSCLHANKLLRMVCCIQLEEDLRVLRHEIRQSGETGVQLPVNFRRLIWNAQKIFKCKPHRPGPSGNLKP